ncbi:MAG: hypothetical protein Phyf2KO_01280 [Phycisphaerales bacterium]
MRVSIFLSTLFAATFCVLASGCIGHRLYNTERDQYLREVAIDDSSETTFDLAIIEFDDHGVFWKIEQLEDTLEMIRERNASSQRGILVVLYVHGWRNNADPNQDDGDLVRFQSTLSHIAGNFANSEAPTPDRVIGVFLGWRGNTSNIPIQNKLTFWGRRSTAERVASLNMRETMFSVMREAKSRDLSKCIVVGHSMGGLIVGKTLAPSVTTLLLANGDEGARIPADLVLLQNPALDGLSSLQFIDFLKRNKARAELRSSDGTRFNAPGPVVVSITSEADRATSFAYPLGRWIDTVGLAFRGKVVEGGPSQRYLATHSEGHVDFLHSHRAWVDDGELQFERVPDAYNDTPFWIVQVSKDVMKDHGDLNNPVVNELVERILLLNRLYETDLDTWILSGEE